jgi:hypothetical protein
MTAEQHIDRILEERKQRKDAKKARKEAKRAKKRRADKSDWGAVRDVRRRRKGELLCVRGLRTQQFLELFVD